jgi:hypothetical protein
LTFSRTASFRAGFKYRIMLSTSECPSRTEIDAGPEAASRERGPEFVQPEIVVIELGAPCNHLEIV